MSLLFPGIPFQALLVTLAVEDDALMFARVAQNRLFLDSMVTALPNVQPGQLAASSWHRVGSHVRQTAIARAPSRTEQAAVLPQPVDATTTRDRGASRLRQARAGVRPQCLAAASGPTQEGWQHGVFAEAMRVRDYELDQFGVVNNAIYASFFQHARHEALASLGFDVDESARSGNPLALSELQLSFKAPLRSRDRFSVSCWVEKVGGARVTLGQAIELLPQQPNTPAPQQLVTAAAALGGPPKQANTHQQAATPQQATTDTAPGTAKQGGGQIVAQAVAVVVWLDAQYRPTRVPADVRKMLQSLLDRRLEAAQHPSAKNS